MVFLPFNMMLLTNFVTNTSLNLGSGSIILFLGFAFLITLLLFYQLNNYFFAPSLGRFVPYLERLCFLPSTPAVSKAPRMM